MYQHTTPVFNSLYNQMLISVFYWSLNLWMNSVLQEIIHVYESVNSKYKYNMYPPIHQRAVLRKSSSYGSKILHRIKLSPTFFLLVTLWRGWFSVVMKDNMIHFYWKQSGEIDYTLWNLHVVNLFTRVFDDRIDFPIQFC